MKPIPGKNPITQVGKLAGLLFLVIIGSLVGNAQIAVKGQTVWTMTGICMGQTFRIAC